MPIARLPIELLDGRPRYTAIDFRFTSFLCPMTRFITHIIVLGLLIGLVFITRQPPVEPHLAVVADDINRKLADSYVACSAYYLLTAQFLAEDGDAETGLQYQDRAASALEQAEVLSATGPTQLFTARTNVMASMGMNGDQEGHGLAELGATYDEQCLSLLDD